MNILRSSWFPLLLGLLIIIFSLNESLKPKADDKSNGQIIHIVKWNAPDTSDIPNNSNGDLIRYGRELIVNTSLYFGPKGRVAPITNGMNCQNCHINAGCLPFGNCFSAVAANYPRYRDRSGRVESIEFRINECMERSLNGKPIDSLSKEMRAMVKYLKWVGEGIPKGSKPEGAGIMELKFLSRPADTLYGKFVYISRCQQCHGPNGEGILNADSTGYIYPPLWGRYSYNVSAGLYRISRFASYVRNNMPFGVSYQNPTLSDEDAWDVAAYVNSQPRPVKFFSYDWPKINAKPVDHPFGPYADNYTEIQHKFGPFTDMPRPGSIVPNKTNKPVN